jgi:multidrug efflux pump subunit AcrA (membrane-fusion protein)
VEGCCCTPSQAGYSCFRPISTDSGQDLILIGPGGKEVVIGGYFSSDFPPDLMTGDGALLSADLVVKLAGPLTPGQDAQAGPGSVVAEAISKVDAVDGTADAIRVDGTGTTVAGKVGAEGEESNISLLPNPDGTVGEITVSNGAGTQVLNTAGATTTVIRFNLPPSAVHSISSEQASQSYYKVRIETPKDHFSHGKPRYYLFPGMQVLASIKTGERTVLQYSIDPLPGYASDAMQGR